jgi:hypothetical protein
MKRARCFAGSFESRRLEARFFGVGIGVLGGGARLEWRAVW